MDNSTDSPHVLNDGARIAVIGGGPTGSLFSFFALKMAELIDRELKITIFEPKDFTREGPAGCNHCGGIISELLVQMLAVEGVNLPDTVMRRGINSYNLHTEGAGDVHIETPHLDNTIATVSRGGGPRGQTGSGKEGFDQFLLKQAVELGAVHRQLKIDRVEYRGMRPVLYAKDEEVGEFDLVVGAFGVNSLSWKIFEGMGFGYKNPPTIISSIAELQMGEETVTEYFGNSVHLFLLPDKGLKFAAMIPKGSYVTLCILGSEVKAGTLDSFLEKPLVKKVLPEPGRYTVSCRCLPRMNVGAPRIAFSDRVVICGDAGSTRLFKDGIGAAYIMGKAVAKTAVFFGVGEKDFRDNYKPVYNSLITDNKFGRFLYAFTDITRQNGKLTKGMIEVVRKEQADPNSHKIMSSILWDMFTGNERYKNIFPRTLSPRMNLDLVIESAKALFSKN